MILFVQCLIAGEKTEETVIKKQMVFHGSSGRNLLIIKNFRGDIKVTGHSKHTVDVKVKKTVWARSPEQFAQALKDVILDISEEENLIEFYVDGPFRDRNRRNQWHSGRYQVNYAFEVYVHFETDLELETVNDGDIRINQVHGVCAANNVNGGIEAGGIYEAGKIYALNEDVSVQFEKNPTQNCVVGSLNGDVRLVFQPGLSADFVIETFNGEAYSDFKTTRLQTEPYFKEKKNQKNYYKTGHKDRIRIGRGGPEIYWQGFNGDLLILDRSNRKNKKL